MSAARTVPGAPAAPKAYSYVRFSTPEQSAGDSERRQADAAARYCKQHGLELDTSLTLRDLGISAYKGANRDKGALGAFLQAIADGDVAAGSVLLVEDIDRLTRQGGRDALDLIGKITANDVAVVELGSGMRYDASSMDELPGPLMALVKGYLAREESRKKSIRLRQARAETRREARASGKLITRIVPGWIRVEDDGKRVAIPAHAAIVKRIFREFDSGAGADAIVRGLNRDKVPSFGRGTVWHKSYIHRIVRSPTVIGQIVPLSGRGATQNAEAPIDGYYPAVIDRPLWDRVQARVAAQKPGRPLSKLGIVNPLAGLARCPLCGGAMARVWKRRAGGRGVNVLVCARARLSAGCEFHSVRCDAIQDALVRLGRDDIPAAGDLSEELRGAQATLDALEEQIAELVDAVEKSSSKALIARLEAREAARDAAAVTLAELTERVAESDTRTLRRKKLMLRTALTAKPFDAAAVNAALKDMVTHVVVDFLDQSLRLHWKHDGASVLDYAPLVDTTKRRQV